MKARFFAFLAAIAIGCTSVLIYASYSERNGPATQVFSTNIDDCGSCAHAATTTTPVRQTAPAPAALNADSNEGCCATETAKPATATLTTQATDGCCATEAAKPAVATLAAPGCPYVATEATGAKPTTTD